MRKTWDTGQVIESLPKLDLYHPENWAAAEWSVVGIAALLILLVVALIVGTILRKNRRISFQESSRDEVREVEDKSGGYTPNSAINFAPATATVTKEPTTSVTSPELVDGPAPAPPETTTQPALETTVADQHETTTLTPSSATDPAPDVTAAETATSHSLEPTEPAAEQPAQAQPPAATEAEDSQPSVEDIEPVDGRLEKLRGRLSRSQSSVGAGLLGILGAGDLDEDAWQDVEDTLIMSDIGAEMTEKIKDQLREELAAKSVRTEAQAKAALRKVLIDQLDPTTDRSIKALPADGKPAVLLVVGVNGTGKTTTTGKLARVLVASGRTIVLGAADTFRAAAADQLQTWAQRVGAEIVRGKEGADPASVGFDAVAHAIDTGADAVLVDTAGRLHTKTGLMDELGKVKRVIEKKAPVDEVLLVLDATFGQNGLIQAKSFSDLVDITGVVLTKLDGTAKGGIVFRVEEELGVPVKLVGLGEGADDLAPFEPEAFVDALLC